ncbi:unnamed protein product, partial [marine sediment metagenome]
APGVARYQASGGGMAGATAAAKNYAFINEATNQFDMATGAITYTPLLAVTVVDFITSKVGLQRRVASGINGILG